ncbi:hypothetical protein AB3S75_002047 [Citrus x aurantiifolia]
MIQELLGATGFISGDRKISITGSIFEGTTSPLPPCTTTTTATVTTTTATAAPPPPPPPLPTTTTSNTDSNIGNNTNNTSSNSGNNQNLRCPRCDSSNTKFCYYNNYNLTQPRHFCKTCRRYWTKGGALRNVPIGGGCRKNKSSSTVSAASFGKSSSSSSAANKMKTVAYEIGRGGFVHHPHEYYSSTPIMWNNSPHNSQLLALLRTSQNPNINPTGPSTNTSSVRVKEEQGVIGTHHVIKGEPVGDTAAVLNSGTMVFNPLSQQLQVPSQFGLWKNNQHQIQAPQQNGFLVGHEVQNSGVQELYQRFKSSTNNYYADHLASPVVLSNAASSTTTILESAPVAGGELGYWNPVFSWSDLSTTNGSYP